MPKPQRQRTEKRKKVEEERREDRKRKRGLEVEDETVATTMPTTTTEPIESTTEQAAAIEGGENAALNRYMRQYVAGQLEQYVENECPLVSLSERIGTLCIEAFRPRFINLVVEEARPVSGVVFSLKTYLAALIALITEVMDVAARKYNGGAGFKRGATLALSVERVDVGAMRDLARHNLFDSGGEMPDIDDRLELTALYNDRELNYLEGYVGGNRQYVNLFVLRIGATLLSAMIVPATALQYELQRGTNHYIRSYATLQADAKKLLTESQKIITLQKEQLAEKDKEIASLTRRLQRQQAGSEHGKSKKPRRERRVECVHCEYDEPEDNFCRQRACLVSSGGYLCQGTCGHCVCFDCFEEYYRDEPQYKIFNKAGLREQFTCLQCRTGVS